MKRFLKLGVFALAGALATGAYAGETSSVFSGPPKTVPEFLKAFFTDYMKAPYEIDDSVIKAHGNDIIKLQIDETDSQARVYGRVLAALHEHYGVDLKHKGNTYIARMSE